MKILSRILGGAAVALAIILNFYNNHATVDVDEAKDLKG